MRKDIQYILVLLALGGLLFGFKLGAYGLLDPDEPFYSLTAKEMLARHDPWTPFLFGQPQFEKPIGFYWVLYASYKLFGVTEFASRIGPCVAGILTVIITYLWGRVIFKRREIAWLSAVVLASSAEFIALSRVVLTDMWLCLFVTAALYCFSLGYENAGRRKTAWTLVFLFCALGFLTKGPLGVLLPFFGMASFLLANNETRLWKEMPWAAGLAIFLAVGCPWYAGMTARYGTGFLKHFFIHENLRRFFFAEHKSFDRLYFYPMAILMGFFPWSAFVPGAIVTAVRRIQRNDPAGRRTPLFLLLAFAVPFLFFVLAKSKLLSYLFPVFPVLSLIVGHWLYLAYRAVRLHGRPRMGGLALCVLFFGIFPPVLLASLAAYGRFNGIEFDREVLTIGSFFAVFFWAALFFIWKGKYKPALSFILAAVLSGAGLVFGRLLPKAEAAFSSRTAVGWYQKYAGARDDGFLLASKLFVRGVAFYADDRNVGVLAEDPRSVFYTNHPIRILSALSDFERLDPKEFPIYCFLRQKEVKFLRRIAGDRFTLTMIGQDAQRAMVRLDRAY